MDSESAIPIKQDAIKGRMALRDGTPAAIRATEAADDPGVPRLRICDTGTEDIDHSGWKNFFATVGQAGLALRHQDRTGEGATSGFYRFVSRS